MNCNSTWTLSSMVCVCTCYASPTSSITHHRHIRSFDRISQLYSRASLRVACNWPPNSQQSQFRASSYIYIYIYIPPLSDIWFIPTSIVSHPLPLFVHNRHKKNRTSIHREYYYISFFSFYVYIYTFFIIQTRFFTYYLFTICTRCRVARGELESGGGDIPTTTLSIYLSILFRFAIPSFVCLFSNRKEKEAKRRTDGECARFPCGETDSREY